MDQKTPIFHVKWTTGTDAVTSEVRLSSNQWQLFILSRERIVEIRRRNTSEEVHISGRLTLTNLNCPERHQSSSDQIFSRFMRAGSASENIQFDCSPLASRLKFHLIGIVIAFNITQNRIAECKKCVHTKSLMTLSNELEGMLDPSTSCFTDVLLKCEGESIPAHKNILSSRSSVFAAMFKNSMKESIENEVDINDVELLVFQNLLTYIYTGKSPDLTVKLASDLLFAADKYQLQDLKRVCCDFLKDNLSLENALGILALGNFHSENELKYSALNYICDNCKKFSEIEETEEWKTIMKENTALAMEILMGVVKSRDEK